MRELNSYELDAVNGAFLDEIYDAAYNAAYSAVSAVKSAVNSYIESASQMETSTDYQNHPDYIGIGGPF